MKKWILLSSFLFLSIVLSAQDPAAKAILDDLQEEYNKHSSIEVDFELVIDLAESPAETQTGKIIQSGEKYKVQVADQVVYCDGTGIWVHLVDNNEVQINDLESDGEMMSPKDLLRIYESEDFEYAITGEAKEAKIPVQYIEFKPNDPDSEYAKMKMTVFKKTGKMKSLTMFGKDGSKYTIKLKDTKYDLNYDASMFSFDASLYPGIRIEDLRLD